MKKNIFAVIITVVFFLALAGQAFPSEANATVQTDAQASHHQALVSGESSAIEIANLSCKELSALGSAVNTVLEREMKLDNIRKIAAIRAQDLASEAQYIGGLFKGPVGFFRRIFSDWGWIEVEPPENVVTLSIDAECVSLGLSVTATDLATLFFGPLGGAVTGTLSELAKWAGTEIGTKTVLQDIGYAEVKSASGIMTIIYDKRAEVAWVNIDLEDLEDEWKESYGYQNEHIYMYVPFDKEAPDLKKTDGTFDYEVVFKGEAITKFEVGTIVKVINTGSYGLRIHKDDPTGETVKVVPDGWTLRVIGGPQYDIQGHDWWEIREENYESSLVRGWVAEDFLIESSFTDLVPSSSDDAEDFVAAQDKVKRAIEWATDPERKKENWRNLCLWFVAKAFEIENIGWGCPQEGVRNCPMGGVERFADENEFYSSEHCLNPPRGALIFFSGQGSDPEEGIDYAKCGHIGIYLGNGEVVHAYGEVKVQKLTGSQGIEAEDFIGSYIGWTYPPEEWLDDSNSIPAPALSHPWPMNEQNAQNTHCSPYMGPESPNTRLLVEFNEPGLSWCLVSADGTIYLSRQNADAMSIIAIKPDGSHKEIVQSPGVGRLEAIGPGGTLHAMLWEENKVAILALDAEGTELWRRSLSPCPDEWTWSNNLSIGADGTIYASCWDGENEVSSITVFDSDGTERWSLPDVHSYLAVAEDGTVYSVMEEGKVCAYDKQGEKKWEYDGRNDWSGYYDRVKYSIAIGPDGTVFILPNMLGIQDASASRLIALTPTLERLWHVDIPVDINSEYEAVYGPTIAPDGSLYILEGNNLFRISPGGKLELFAEGNFYSKGPIVDATGIVYVSESAYANGEQAKETSQVIALNPDGSEKWHTNPLDFEHIWLEAIGADGTIYARGEHWVSGQGVLQPIIAIGES